MTAQLQPRHHDSCPQALEPTYECLCGLDTMRWVVAAALKWWSGIQYADWPNPEDRQNLIDACKSYSVGGFK